MSSDVDGNHDDNVLPFADYEIASDVHLDIPNAHKSQYNNKKKGVRRSRKKLVQNVSNQNDANVHKTVTHIYFENAEEENNFIKFAPYTGPSNTTHLSRRLHLAQLTSNTSDNSIINFPYFFRDYDRIIESLTSLSESMSLSIYLRFGISYIIKTDVISDEEISLRDFVLLRNKGMHSRKYCNISIKFLYFYIS